MPRGSTAWIGRPCGTGFTASTHGPAGLKDNRRRGNPRRLSAAQQAELAAVVKIGQDREIDGVVRWRRVDLQRVIEERFGVAYHERTIGKLLQPRLRRLRCHHRRRPRRMAKAHRQAMHDNLNRNAEMDACRSIVKAVGISHRLTSFIASVIATVSTLTRVTRVRRSMTFSL